MNEDKLELVKQELERRIGSEHPHPFCNDRQIALKEMLKFVEDLMKKEPVKVNGKPEEHLPDTDRKIPKNLFECVTVLNNELCDEDKKEIKKKPSECFHHTLGMWIRNNWGLWQTEDNELKKCLKSLGLNHPDDMSDLIIRYYRSHLLKDDMTLQEINEYVEKTNKFYEQYGQI